ncbi:MAG TPA: lytic transglycosylase domain-containing protein [Burkholderiales bacterium]
MKAHTTIRLVFAAAALSCAVAQADVYSMVDADGRVRFSNVPNDSRYKLYMREQSAPADKADRVRVTLDKRLPGGGLFANPALQRRPYHAHVLAAAKANDLDPALIHAVITAESNYSPMAVSPKGAIGLMQVMPTTGARFGVTAKALRQPDTNIRIGTQYLAWLLDRFDGDVELALAGYNAGENAVLRHGQRIPPYAETRAYVPRVIGYYEQLRGNRYVAAKR